MPRGRGGDFLTQFKLTLEDDSGLPWRQNLAPHLIDYWFDPKALGGDLSSWIFQGTGQGKINVWGWLRESEAISVRFFEEGIKKSLASVGVTGRVQEGSLSLTGALCPLGNFRHQLKRPEMLLPSYPRMRGKGRRSVSLGAQRGRSLGSFSPLMDIKDVTYWTKRGQAMVEYILMMAVVVSIGVVFLQGVRTYFLRLSSRLYRESAKPHLLLGETPRRGGELLSLLHSQEVRGGRRLLQCVTFRRCLQERSFFYEKSVN